MIRELTPALLAIARRSLRGEDAEDVVQETWISALRNIGSFDGRSSLSTWLITILRRRITDHYRARPAATEPMGDMELASEQLPPDMRAQTRELAQVAGEALASLASLERAAVVQCDIRDFDRDSASAALGVTRSHLRVLLHRAHRKLQLKLAVEQHCGFGAASDRKPLSSTRRSSLHQPSLALAGS